VETVVFVYHDAVPLPTSTPSLSFFFNVFQASLLVRNGYCSIKSHSRNYVYILGSTCFSNFHQPDCQVSRLQALHTSRYPYGTAAGQPGRVKVTKDNLSQLFERSSRGKVAKLTYHMKDYVHLHLTVLLYSHSCLHAFFFFYWYLFFFCFSCCC